MSTAHLHVIILAGGSGMRFWPLSRERMPKQLLNIVGDDSMLASTLERALKLVPENRIWIVTSRRQADGIRRELHALNLERIHVVEEPSARNTAPAVGLAGVHVLNRDPGAILAVFPSDHYISKPDRFISVMRAAEQLAGQDWLVTLGIKPTGPDTGYGYIQRGEVIPPSGGNFREIEAYRAVRFTEKPDRATAAEYLADGGFFWNGGIFVWSADLFMKELERYMPGHSRGFREIAARLGNDPGDQSEVDSIYNAMDSISVDYGIMEHSERVAVIPADMGWSDVGTWKSLHEILDTDTMGNALRGDVVAYDTRDCLIHSEERLVAAVGLEDFVVVETPDAVLACPKSSSQDVKRLVEQLARESRSEAQIHLTTPRQWGSCRILESTDEYVVRRIEMKPGPPGFSPDPEHSRHWTVVRGVAAVILNGETAQIQPGQHVSIPVRSQCRLENRGEEMLQIIEIRQQKSSGDADGLNQSTGADPCH